MATTYIQRTPSGAYYPKATFSFWFKRSGLGEMGLFGRKGSNSTANLSTCHFGSDDSLLINFRDSGGTSKYYQITNRKFRDTNAWYHFHYIIEGDNSTQGDRSRLYINGVRETSFALNNNPSSNSYEIATFLSSDGALTVGRALRSQTNTFGNFNGSISHFHCSTGYAYEPTVFGETDATTGEWKIKTSPTFTPGTDGFTILKDGNTITDQSSNSNDFSLGAGTLTKTEDSPSNVFATWNVLDSQYFWGAAESSWCTNGNTTARTGNSQYSSCTATLGASSGKYYWEFKYDAKSGSDNLWHLGIKSTQDTAVTTALGINSTDYAYKAYNGQSMSDNSSSAYGSTYAVGDIIGVAMDLDNNKLYFRKNADAWANSGNPESGATGTGAISIAAASTTEFGVYVPAFSWNDGSSYGTNSVNFGNGYFGTTAVSSAGTNASGNGIFEYDVPTGYTALSTKGLNL